MTLLQKLTDEFGPNPYSFFWILQEETENLHLLASRQRAIWQETPREFD